MIAQITNGYRRLDGAVNRFTSRWLFALLSAGVLVAGLVWMPTLVSAHHNGGTPGTFIAQDEDCSGRFRICTWSGTFLDDGQTVGHQVEYEGDAALHHDDRIRAQRLGDSAYPRNDSTWLFVLLLCLAAVVYLAWWSLTRRWRALPPSGPD